MNIIMTAKICYMLNIQTYINTHTPRVKARGQQLGRLMSKKPGRSGSPKQIFEVRRRSLLWPQQIADHFNATFRPQSYTGLLVFLYCISTARLRFCVYIYMKHATIRLRTPYICISNVRNVFINNIHPLFVCRMRTTRALAKYTNSAARYLITVAEEDGILLISGLA